MDAAKVDYATAVMLIVSAKHTLFKALYSQVGRSIAYLDGVDRRCAAVAGPLPCAVEGVAVAGVDGRDDGDRAG